MDSLQDLLGKYSPQEPEEVLALKRYIFDEFGVQSSVGLHDETLVITVHSASLANALRLRLPALKKVAGTKRRIMFRIG
jgi:hypothetical protein